MATEERVAHLDAALNDCIQQISLLQEERESLKDLKEANTRLINSLMCKQNLIEEMERDKAHLEAEIHGLVVRVESVEKENAILKCECCALERELVMNMDSAKRIATLEDHENLGDEKSSRKIGILVDRLCDVEEENQAFREIIAAREDELCSSKLKCAQVAYRLAVIEAEIGGSRNSLMNHFMKDSENQFESVSKQIVPVKEKPDGCWPWKVLDMIVDEHQVSKRSIDDLLEEIRVSLAPDEAKLGESALNRSICRMVELLEEISPSSLVEKEEDGNIDYSVHVFRWRNNEMVSILRKFVLSCSLVLSGRQDLEDLVVQLTAMLEWAFENCITLEDASNVRERIRKHFRLDRSRSEGQIEVTSGDGEGVATKMIKTQCDMKEENAHLIRKLRSMESRNEELEVCKRRLTSEIEELRESVGRLREEVEGLKDAKGDIEDQIENQKLINEDLDTQLNVAKAKQNEMIQRLSSLEIELEDRGQCCEELEATCLELQLQLETLSRRGSPEQEVDRFEKNSLTGWEMVACSDLVEFEDSSFEKELAVISTSPTHNASLDNDKPSQHYSLRDRMLADEDKAKTKEIVCVGETPKDKQTSPNAGPLAVVPSKKGGRGGFGFIKKLFLRRKCGSKNGLQRNASTMVR